MAAPVWQTSVEDYVWGNQESGLHVVAEVVNNNEVKLTELVEYLGKYLLSTTDDVRVRGTRVLSQVLHSLPHDKLTTPEVGHLVSFFCDRLQDHHSVTPHALTGLLALSGYSNLAVGDEVLIVQAIMKEVHVQTLMQVDRRAVYNIMARFLDTRLTELKKLGTDFVYGYMQAMDGEKDPRNLVIVFRCVLIIIQNFPFERFTEELFEVTSCYFPIDFSPSPNDPYGVSTEELVLALRKCLAATPKFAEFCLPLLMEKVSSDIQSAKVDSFQTLTACAQSYGATHFSGYMEAIWSSCRREVFQAVSADVQTSALEALHQVVKVFSTSIVEQISSLTSLDSFLESVLTECQQYIKEPDVRLMLPCCTLLQSIANASDPACCKVLASVLPQLMDQYHHNCQTASQRKILDAIHGLTSVIKYQHLSSDVNHPVLSLKDDIVGIYCATLQNDSEDVRQTGVRGLGGLVRLEGLLNASDLDMIGEHLVSILLQDVNANVRVQCALSIATMSLTHPEIVSKKLIPKLSAILKADVVAMEIEGEPSRESIISMLPTITIHPDLIQEIVPLLLDHLSCICQRFSNDKMKDADVTVHSLLSIVEKTSNKQTDLQYYLNSLLPRLLEMVIKDSMVTIEQSTSLYSEETVIQKCAAIFRNISQLLDVRLGKELSDSIIKGYLDKDFTYFGFDTKSVTFHPLAVDSHYRQTQCVVILMSIVCSVDKDVQLLNQNELVEKLFTLATQSYHGYTQTSAAQCLAGILNKWKTGDELVTFLNSCKTRLEVIFNSEDHHDNSMAATRTWNWISKALVLRAHTMAPEFISTMISHLGNIHYGEVAADGFRCILTDVPEVMSAASHADVKIMYRQRFFLQTLPRIVAGFESSKDDCKTFYLRALSYLLSNVSKAVLLNELPPLMPMLVHSLLCEDIALNLSTLEVLAMLLKESPSIISTNVDALLPRIMNLAEYEASMVVRIAAFKCIGDITTLQHYVIFPYKDKLIRFLGKHLDDKKRMVRKEVVQARNKWFLLGAASD